MSDLEAMAKRVAGNILFGIPDYEVKKPDIEHSVEYSHSDLSAEIAAALREAHQQGYDAGYKMAHELAPPAGYEGAAHWAGVAPDEIG